MDGCLGCREREERLRRELAERDAYMESKRIEKMRAREELKNMRVEVRCAAAGGGHRLTKRLGMPPSGTSFANPGVLRSSVVLTFFLRELVFAS